MAFIDTLRSKTISLSNQISDRARDSSEQFRLEGDIRKLTSEIESTYTAIGKEVYNSRQEEREANIDLEIQAITDKKQQIEEKRNRIEMIKAQIVCPNCGKMMPAGTLICTACGKSMEKREEPVLRRAFCAQCGSPIAPDDSFCQNCGAKIGGGVPAVNTVQTPPEVLLTNTAENIQPEKPEEVIAAPVPEEAPAAVPVVEIPNVVPEEAPTEVEPQVVPESVPAEVEPEAVPETVPAEVEPEVVPDVAPVVEIPEFVPDSALVEEIRNSISETLPAEDLPEENTEVIPESPADDVAEDLPQDPAGENGNC